MKMIPAKAFQVQLCFLAALFGASFCPAQQLVVTGDKIDARYAANEPVTWKVAVTGGEAGAIKQGEYSVKRCGQTVIKQGTLDLSTGSGQITASLDEPGTMLVEIDAAAGDKKIKGMGGAAIAPEKILPSAPRPDDFDAFWAEQIRELNLIPPQPDVVPAETSAAGVEYFKIRMNNIQGSEIYGQLAKPKRPGKFPALLILQWAGVYGLPSSRVVDRARQGWLALNIMPHDLPLDEPDAFYKRLAATTLNNYYTFGNEDRQTSYFRRMYLSAYRAADYLAGRSDWDGKTLVVMGASQGGQQTIMLAGLHPKITAAMALVPSSCDVTGRKLGRAIGYPSWADQAREKNNPAILETARYFDPVNFASHITCPALISMGLLDETSPPAGVFAACNQMKGATEVLPLVNSNHAGDHNAQAPFNRRAEVWLKAIARGDGAPAVNR